MADRTIISPAAVPSAYADTTVLAAFSASDVANKNRYLWTGREVLEVRNVGMSGRAIVLTSQADAQQRTNDVSLTLGAGEYRILPYLNKAEGWVQSDGYIWFEGAHADVEWRVLRLP